MKSTQKLTRENNVKALRLNNTDREIFENYMNYVRADVRVNHHDSEKMLNRVLKQLLSAEDEGLMALDFFDHDPKAHAIKELKALPNETIRNIFKYIMNHILLILGIFAFLKGFIGFFVGFNRIYLYTFPISLILGIILIFLFIWLIFKTIQLQCFSRPRWVWLFTYASVIILLILFFYTLFIPQSFLAVGPAIYIDNWVFIILSFILIPLALILDHYNNNKENSTSLL